MSYDLSKRLVVGIASSALFNIDSADAVFKKYGEKEYRKYQRENLDVPFDKGVAFPFIQRLLSLNDLRENDPVAEVILLSKNDPDTGLRVFRSIEHYGLNISRAAFLQGKSPYPFIKPFHISLFLTANKKDATKAIEEGHPAGLVLQTENYKDIEDKELRIAFDFDGVLADDEAETVSNEKGVEKFHEYEKTNSEKPLNSGPLKPFLEKIAEIQKIEAQKQKEDESYKPRLRISIVTARNAPAHERVITTLRDWDIIVDEGFFLGGIEKTSVLDVIQPHIFFEDQIKNLDNAKDHIPSVHIPFGIKNII
ncbi:MAG: 5'-nucleotidase [Alphaproteobacteria bacterium]|nr:5'-nucleotidase [Alphaproteobacteria bacterium]